MMRSWSPLPAPTAWVLSATGVVVGCMPGGHPAHSNSLDELRQVAVQPGHLIFRVAPGSVEAAARSFEAAGFTVARGGPDSDLVNAMIYLDDGWFIELFGLGTEVRVVVPLFFARVLDAIAARRFARLVQAQPGGFIDWSVDVPDVAAARAALAAQGIEVSAARTYRRVQRDGTTTEWELAMPSVHEVPFLKSSYRRHSPVTASMRHHENGAAGIVEVVIGSPDPSAASECLRYVADRVAEDHLVIAGVEVRVDAAPEFGIRRISLRARVDAPTEVEIDGAPTGLWLVPADEGTRSADEESLR